MNYHGIRQLSAELGVRINDLIALSPNNDPFYAGLPSREQDARWFANLWESFGWGAGLHLRRAHYVLISQKEPILKPNGEPYENTVNNWVMLGCASLAARYLKLVPTGALVDRRNPNPILYAENSLIAGKMPYINIVFRNPEFGYRLPGNLTLDDDLWPPDFQLGDLSTGQPYLVELWVEKSTQNDILVPLARRLGVNLVPGTGETSEILARQSVERAIAAGRSMRILYISDFDPGGRSMPVALARKIEFILRDASLGLDITLEPIVLLPEQCERYQLPRTPLKESERRAPKFEQRFGAGATELDALEALHPGELARIVGHEVCRYIDPTLSGRCRSAFWQLERWLNNISEQARAPYADALAAINARYNGIQSGLQSAIDEAREDMQTLEDEAGPLWRQIVDDLTTVTPEIDPAHIPTARPADPIPEPLFDSRRDYLDQLDHYRRWQGRDHE